MQGNIRLLINTYAFGICTEACTGQPDDLSLVNSNEIGAQYFQHFLVPKSQARLWLGGLATFNFRSH